MLYIILTILKIIGIIIAVLLGLIIFTALVVLINPVRYRAKVNYDAEPDIEVRFSYLFHIVRGVFVYNKDGSDAKIKVAWFNLSNKTAPNKKPKKDKKHKSKQESVEPSVEEENEKPQLLPELRTAENVHSDEVKSSESHTSAADNSTSESKENNKSNSTTSKKNRFKDMHTKMSSLKGSLLGFITNITDENNKESFLYILLNLKKIIKHIHPQKHKVNVYFGTNDPALTGQITGSLAVAATVLNINLFVYPDFDKSLLKINSWYKGRVRFIVLGIILLKMYRNKKLKATIKQFMK